MTIKIAMVGARSTIYMRRLLRMSFQHTAVTFMNTPKRDLQVTELREREIQVKNPHAKILPTFTQHEVIPNADYPISAIRPGGLNAFKLDIETPKYCVIQCVGDTICAGGIMHTHRTARAHR